MNWDDYPYVDTAFGGPDKRNNVIRLTDIPHIMPDVPDCYYTWHRFAKDYQAYATSTGGIKGYKGASYADFLPFDIDREGDLEGALSDTRALVARLEVDYDIPTESMRLWFSGSKGFHLCVSAGVFGPQWTPGDTLPGHLKRLAARMAGDVGIDSSIYDQNRLWRIPNTVNSKTGLYKLPIPVEELPMLTVDHLLHRAQGPEDTIPWATVYATPAAAAAFGAARQTDSKSQSKTVITDLFSVMQEGEGRQQHAFRLACKMRDWHMPRGPAIEMLELWDSTLPVSLKDTDGDSEIDRIVQNAYGDAGSTDDRITPESVRSMSDLAEDYGAYIQVLKGRTIHLGYNTVDDSMRQAYTLSLYLWSSRRRRCLSVWGRWPWTHQGGRWKNIGMMEHIRPV